MREIKFRGKSIDTNEWVYGTPMDNPDGDSVAMIVIGKERVSVIAVNPETVGQFTGLRDKNGVEDYHKDICRYTDDSGKSRIGIIEQDIGCWWLVAIGGDDEGNQNVLLFHADGHENIGNIHENPELMEV